MNEAIIALYLCVHVGQALLPELVKYSLGLELCHYCLHQPGVTRGQLRGGDVHGGTLSCGSLYRRHYVHCCKQWTTVARLS